MQQGMLLSLFGCKKSRESKLVAGNLWRRPFAAGGPGKPPRHSLRALPGEDGAAVDVEDFTSDKARVLGAEKEHRGRDLFRLSHAS